jgi:hypothetical protein
VQIRKHHADRILAVARTAIAEPALVPARQTWALLNEVLETGYTETFLAKQLSSRAKKPSLPIQADRITRMTAKHGPTREELFSIAPATVQSKLERARLV